MPDFLLSLDCGTTSVKALVARADGHVLAVARRAITSDFPSPGLVEQDANRLWEDCVACLRDAVATAEIDVTAIRGLGITTQRASVVLFDRTTGHAVAPMVVWSDVRGMHRAAELQNDGYMVWPQTPASKLEAILARLDGAKGELLFGTLDTYLAYRLSGGKLFASDISSGWASGYSDYFQGGRVWNDALIAHQGLPRTMFGDLIDSYGDFGTLDVDILGHPVKITAIVADQQAGLFGHATIGPQGWKASFGTSAVVIATTGALPATPHFTMPPQALMGHAGETHYCVEGMVITAGVLLEWLCRGLNLFDSPAALAAASAGSTNHGVVIRPSWQGLGAPHGRFAARGVIAGLSPGAGKNAIARAALEGIALRCQEIVVLMREAGLGGAYLPIDGGVAASPEFCQCLSDICQIPIKRHAVRDGAAYGVMVAAGLGAGLFDIDALPKLARYDREFTPQIDQDAAAALLKNWREGLADAALT